MAQVKPVKKHKMSKGSRIAIVVAVVMLLALALSLLAGSGFFFRIQKGASSDNFKVNAAMMEYYANSYYQNWYSQNYYYIMLEYINFKPELPFEEQYTDSSKTQTYYDYFVQGTKTTVETYLKYCEAAKADGTVDFDQIEKDAKEYAKTSIKQLKESAKQYSDSYYEAYGQTISVADYIRMNFGEHVSKNDIKKAIIIEQIASAYYDIIYERVNGQVNDKREDKYFEDNLSTFIKAEYLVYTLSNLKTVVFPKAEDYVGGEKSPAYLALVEGKTPEQVQALKLDPADYEGGEEAKAYKTALKTAEDNKKANEESLKTDKAIIEKLAAAANEEEFKKILLEENYTTNFKTAYNSAVNKFDSKDKLSTDALESFMGTLKEALIEATLANESDIDATLINVEVITEAFLNDRYSAHFDAAYNAAVKDFAAENKPSQDILDAFKTDDLKNAIIDAVIAGKETLDDESLLVFPEGASDAWKTAAKELPKTIIKSLKTGSEKWVDAAKALPASAITNLKKVITNATKSGSYTLSSKLGQALFGGVKGQFGIEYETNEDANGTSAKAGDVWMWNMLEVSVENAKLAIKTTEEAIKELEEEIATETDADAKATLEASKKTLETSLETAKETLKTAEEKLANVETTSYYSYSAYFVTEAAHRDDYKARNVGHILFKVDATKETDPAVSYKTKEEAKAAADALFAEINAAMVDGKISKEKFEEFGAKTHDSNVFYDDVKKGDMVEEFEDWLFNATVVGNIGLVETTYGWHIMYYGGEAEKVVWRETANEGATAEDISAWYEELPGYGIEFNDKIFPKIFGVSENHEGHNH